MTQAPQCRADRPSLPADLLAGNPVELDDAVDSVEHHGHAVLSGPADESATADFDALIAGSSSGSRRVSPHADLAARLINQPTVQQLIARLVGPDARPVRAIAFDKTADANWLVPWHQDRTIAVDQQQDAAEVTNWTVKRGVVHCEPPVHVLERMLTLRWHFDGIGLEDGCLRVLPGTHRLGRLTRNEIARHLSLGAEQSVPVPAGSIFAMRPLLVHSSRRRTTSGRRRVLHVELAAGDPPIPLQWAWA